MFLLVVPQTRAHRSRWSLPQDHGLCWWCDGVSCVCTETQSMRQCLSRSFVLSKIKCEWRSSSHRLALGCAKPFGVFEEEVSQRHVSSSQRDRWFAGHSRIKAKAKLHSDAIGCDTCQRFLYQPARTSHPHSRRTARTTFYSAVARKLLGSYADLARRGSSLKSSRAVLAIFSLTCGKQGRRGLLFSVASK